MYNKDISRFCLCIHMCVSACVHAYVCTCVHVEKPERMMGGSSLLFTYSLEAESLLEFRVCVLSAKLEVSKMERACCLPFWAEMPRLLHWCWTLNSGTHGYAGSTLVTTEPSPTQTIFTDTKMWSWITCISLELQTCILQNPVSRE